MCRTLDSGDWGAMLASAFLGRHPTRVDRAVLIEPDFLSAAEAHAFLSDMQGYLRSPRSVRWHWSGSARPM